MWAKMMLSEKLKDAIVILPLGEAELDGPPVDPHDVVIRASATMLAPRTHARFKRILLATSILINSEPYAVAKLVADFESRSDPVGRVRRPWGVAKRCKAARENSTMRERMATRIAPAYIMV